jgi:hypothetical protein
MKKLILSVTAIAGLAMAGNSQQVFFHDSTASAPTSNDVSINGVIDTTQDLNLELLVGTTAGNVNVDVVTLLIGATSSATTGLGSTQSAAGDISSLGLIDDQTSNAYKVAGGTAFYQVLAWTGNSATFPGLGVAGTTAGESPVYAFDLAGGIPASGAPAAELDIPTPFNLVTTAVVMPEPSTLAMAGVGLASMLMFRSRKQKA